jgi:hypothetical protein
MSGMFALGNCPVTAFELPLTLLQERAGDPSDIKGAH